MLNVVLVEPEIPQNCGNIARTCAATGCRLHLIRPLGFDISEKAVKRAGLDYWNLVEVLDYENLEDFFARNKVERMWCLSTKAPELHGGRIPGRGLPVLWQGDQGPPGALPGSPQGKLCPHPHASGGQKPEPEQRGGGNGF